jgi:hypothetical protein
MDSREEDEDEDEDKQMRSKTDPNQRQFSSLYFHLFFAQFLHSSAQLQWLI